MFPGRHHAGLAPSSSTTSWPRMCSAWAVSTGSWRPRCSRRWQASIVRRSRRWPVSTRPPSPHPPDRVNACRSPWSGTGEGNHWPPASAGIPLRRVRTAVLTDQRPVMASARRNELIHRLLAGRCEICEDTVNLEVHHVRKLADLSKPGRREKPAWMHLMAKRRAKDPSDLPSLPRGHPRWPGYPALPEMITGEQGAGKLASPVREETDGKGPGQGHLAGGRLHSRRRSLETEQASQGHGSEAARRRNPEKWLPDLTPDTCNRASPDPPS
jgi:hypothetical protein